MAKAEQIKQKTAAAAWARLCLWLLRLQGARRACCALLLGVLAAQALPPLYVLPLCFLSFSALCLLLDSLAAAGAPWPQRLKQAAFIGWCFGFGYFTAGLWWLANAMTVDMRHFGWAIPFAVFGLPAFLACYYALAACAAALFWRQGLSRLLALSLAFAAAEYGRGIAFTGFPWNAVGYTLMPCPLLMQADAVLGLNGMNALAVLLYSLPVLAAKASPFNRSGGRLGLGLGAALAAALLGFGAWRLAQANAANAARAESGAPVLRVRLVQPAIPQEEKQNRETQAENFARLLALSRQAPQNGGKQPDLIIWPETSSPYLLDYNPGALAEIGRSLKPGQLLLAGAIRAEAAPAAANAANAPGQAERYRFFNSAELINADGQIIAHADKVHLVPFGEYLPFNRLLRRLHLSALIGAGPYSAAPQRRFITLPSGIKILPLICYEAVFPRESRASLTKGGESADIIVNLTNDAWFGNSPGPRQHLEQARLRAVEQNRPLLRAANNGISAYSDAYGRIRASLPLNQIGFLDIDVPLPPR